MARPGRDGRAAVVAVALGGLLLVATIAVVSHRQAEADAERGLRDDTSSPMRFELLAGRFSDAGPSEEFAAYYPDTITAHAGDTIVITNPTADDPHTVTFGLAPDRHNQPLFGTGADHAAVIDGPCASDEPLTPTTTQCHGQAAPLPPFSGQAYYNTGIIAPGGGTFELRLHPDLAPGTYPFACLIHGRQVGRLDIVVTDEPTQRPSDLSERSERLASADDREVRRLHAGHTGPLHPTQPGHVMAGFASDRASSNVFEPADVTVGVGSTVTWHNDGSVPHVMVFGGDLPPDQAIVMPPTRPSGSTLPPGPFTTGPIGGPPYPRSSFTLRFSEPGTYAYTCTFHVGMSGTVTVVASTSPRE